MNDDVKLIQLYNKKNNCDIIEMIGMIVILIISKNIFKKNSDVAEFIETVIGINFPGYVIKSRTLMAARASKIVFALDDNEIRQLKIKINAYLSKLINQKDDEKVVLSKNRKKNENDKLEKWLKGL
ncbi:hypothetical protein [Butyribacter intestini]|uniref:Uncharacterized protein n=1 Tax=Butyribacter intestini TaxID=1703332 RepID=A0AAW3JT54_9FIRM|nr:hypothetical protein [Butyribacter intestini]KQC86048.1 hypothetical protein APZ18_02315 [Butyribacter intestini]RHU77152.1 hypothetical protein DXC30_02350 [Butyribacter intestini]